MKQYLTGIKDSALRSLYVKEVAESLNIDEKAVLEKVREEYQQSKQGSFKSYLIDEKKDEDKLASDRREKQVISMVLNYPEIIDDIKNTDVLECFYSEKLKLIGQKIISITPDKKAFITNIMAKMENSEDQKLIASLSMDDSSFLEKDIRKTALSLINRIIRVRKREENILTSKIISAEKGCDSELMELLKEKQAEIQQLQ